MLNKIETSNKQLEVSCSVLEKASILEPFAIEVPSDGEAKAKIEGLLKNQSEKIQGLDNKQIIEMYEKNSLDLIYAPFFDGRTERLTTEKI